MARLYRHLRRRERFAIALSTLLLGTCAVLVVLWVASYVRVVSVQRRPTVESGSVIEGTAGPISEYISHTRALASVAGRVYFGYMRADGLDVPPAAAARLPYACRFRRFVKKFRRRNPVLSNMAQIMINSAIYSVQVDNRLTG